MPLSSFCGLLTLQVGASILAVVFFTLAGVILAANIFEYHNANESWPASLILMLIFVIGLIVIGLLMFISSYAENRRFAMFSVIGIVLLICYWIILCCFSFVSNPEHVNTICIVTRCPESFWISSLAYRRQHENLTATTTTTTETPTPSSGPKRGRRFVTEEYDLNKHASTDMMLKQVTPIFLETEQNLEINITSSDDMSQIEIVLDDDEHHSSPEVTADGRFDFLEDDKNKTSAKKGDKKEDEEESRIKYGFSFIGALALFLANLVFLIFAALVMWSWASELDWADYYVEDEPVVVYETEPY